MLGFFYTKCSTSRQRSENTVHSPVGEKTLPPVDFNLADDLNSGQFQIVDKHFGYETPFCRASLNYNASLIISHSKGAFLAQRKKLKNSKSCLAPR